MTDTTSQDAPVLQVRDLSVDFAVDWLGRHRSTLAPARGITYGDVVVAHGR